LSAAKSDWVSRSQSARYSVVCGRVRLVDTNRSCVGNASEARSGARDRKKRSGQGLEYAGDPRKTRERSGRPRKVQERIGRWRKMRIRSRDKVSRGVAATFLFRGSQGKKK